MTGFSADDLCQHAAAMRRLARDLLADAALADDAVQQAYVTALTRPPAARVAVGAWLRAVVRSCALDLRRSEGRRRRREQLVSRSGPPAPDSTDGLDLQQDIVAAVRALDGPYRTVVWLRYYEGQMPSEIAEHLGEPVKTIKTRLFRALQLLRARLDARAGGRRAWLAAIAPLARLPISVDAFNAAHAAGVGLVQGKKLVVAAAALLLVLAGPLVWRSFAEAGPVETPAPRAASTVLVEARAAVPAAEAGGQRVDAATPVEAKLPYGALAVRVRWHDGAAAGAVAMTFLAEHEPQLDRNESRAVSDAAGIARAERLHAGSVLLRSDRGGELRAEVVAGKLVEVAFVLPRGVDVTGTVFDEARHPVPGARIVLVSGLNGISGASAIAKAGASGSFAVRAVDPQWSLMAEAAGYAPSSLVDLETVEHAAGAAGLQVELFLLHRGGGVAGKVQDELGRGIAGAVIAIGKGGTVHWGTPVRESWSGAVSVADENGDFSCDGLAPGRLPIAARADGYACVESEVTCAVGATKRVLMVLPRGVTVHGCVRDEQRGIVAGATIRALAVPAGDTAIDSGRQNAGMLLRPETRSDAEGNYRLQFVSPGTVHLLASGPGTGASFEGVARASMPAHGGDEVAWDPVLVAGKTIRVVLVNEHDNPRVTPVTAIPEQAGHAEPISGLPDRPSNAVVFKGCADVPHTVAVMVVVAEGRRKWIYQTGVRPGDPEVRLVVPPPPKVEPPGSISGGVVDAGHRFEGRSARLRLQSISSRRDLKLEQGRFHIEDVPPGRYFVQAETEEGPVANGPWFDLGSGQHLDVGNLVTEPGVGVRVAVRAPLGADLGVPAGILGKRFDYRKMRWDGEHLVAANLTPGRYLLRVRAKGWYALPHEIEVKAGQDTLQAVDVVSAIERSLEFVFPLPGQWQQCDVLLRDAQGKIVAEVAEFTSDAIGPSSYVWKSYLPFGQFTLEAMLDGKRFEWPVDLRESADSTRAWRFSLRER